MSFPLIRPEFRQPAAGVGTVLFLGSVAEGVLGALVLTGRVDAASAVLGMATVGAAALWAIMRRSSGEAPLGLTQQPGGEENTNLSEGALESLPDPLLVISALEADDLASRRVLFANAAARDFLRIPKQGIPLVSAMRDPEILEVVDEALFGGIAGDTAYQPGGAQDRFWSAFARPLPPAANGARRAVLILRDETDARRNERMRADFLANASHELRTPLASLTGFIETLRGHAKDDVAARDRFLGIMATQTQRMSRLIDDLMSLSRIELNEHIAPAGLVDLSMTVVDVIDALGPQAKAAGVRIAPNLPARGEAVVLGDRHQIVQVIQNLLDNAIKYAGADGQVGLELTEASTMDAATAARDFSASRLSLLTPDRSRERYAVLRVSDSGPGIPRAYLPRLTERFYRVEGQKSGDRSGTGLGLAIVKHIVNRHRGGLAIETAEGRGATFVVYFPLCRSHPPSEGQSSPAAEQIDSAPELKLS